MPGCGCLLNSLSSYNFRILGERWHDSLVVFLLLQAMPLLRLLDVSLAGGGAKLFLLISP